MYVKRILKAHYTDYSVKRNRTVANFEMQGTSFSDF